MPQPLTDEQLAAIRARHTETVTYIATMFADRRHTPPPAYLEENVHNVGRLLAEIDRLRARIAGRGLVYDATAEQLLVKARDARAENDKLRRENQRLRAVADQYEAAIDRVNNACDAIEAEYDGDYDDDAEGAREAVARIRAAADDPQP